MRPFIAGPILLIAACSGGNDRRDGSAVDVNAAAARAEGDIANDAAATPTPSSSPVRSVTPADPAPAVPPGNSLSEARFKPGSAQGAGDVVQRYYALIGEHRYRDAWALWSGRGKASGMNAAAFGASFDKYADYQAEVGAPGAVDAGAGQRYVTVPVRIYGTLKEGARPFAMSGTIILHRVADGIDTPDAQDHEWRIGDTEIKPRPADAVTRPPPSHSPAPPDRPD